MSRDATYIRLIHSMSWRKLRMQVLAQHPLCADCLQEGRTTAASEVHHVRPIETGKSVNEMERLAYDPHNLRPLCHACHRAEHIRMSSHSRSAIKEGNRRSTQRFLSGWLGEMKEEG